MVGTDAGGLRQVRTGLDFPFVPYPPIHCHPLDGHLCVAAIEGSVEDTRVILLDREGQPSSVGLVIPLLVTGLVVSDWEVVLTGTRPDESVVVAGLELEGGTISWMAEIPVPYDVTRVAEPLAIDGRLYVMWESGFAPSILGSAEVTEAGCGDVRQVRSPDSTSSSALAAVADRVALARVHGERHQLDLLWLADGVVADTVPLAERTGSANPSVGALPGAAVVAWDDGDGLRVSRIEVGARRPTAELRVPLRPSERRSCTVITGSDGQIAVIWHVVDLGDPEPLAEVPGRWEPTELVESWVTTLDPEAWRLTDPVCLDPPGTLHGGGGWVGDRLVLVHGDQQPVITVLEEV